ncbi:MAG: FtsX-like permease family protein [Thermodesulfovibrionales bacterium]|nr:FtsX-like permease family protein [Thermodesulfovibrionales bacterium]
MKFSLLSLALKNLKRKSFRTAVLITSIGLLVSILVFGTSFLLTISSSIKRSTDRLGADLLVVPVGARDFAEEVLLETKAKNFYMDKSIIEKVGKIEGIEKLTYQTYLTTIYGLCCDIPAVKVVAFNQETDFIIKPWLERAIGRKLGKGEVIIGAEAAENFELLDVDRSTLFGMKFNMAGVLEKTGTGLDNALFVSDENIGEIIERGKSGLRPDQISLIFTKVKKGLDPYAVGRSVEGEILEVDVIARSDMGKKIISTLKDINGIFLLTIVLACLLSTFLAWTIFSAIVNERLREVGIMRAIGAKGSHIVKMFIIEVFTIGLIGSLSGVMFGNYLSLTLSRVFGLLRDVAGTLTLMERVEVSLLGLAVGTGICIIGALSSIIRIKRLEPLMALKEG